MSFDQGNISFRICRLPEAMPADTIARFAEHAAGPLDRVKDEPQWGWVSPRHLLDSHISDETIYNAGFYHLCLRQAERKIPASLLSAECRMIELARMAEKGHERLGNKERKTIKEEVQQRLLPTMPPQISGIYFAIDCTEKLLYTSATSTNQLDLFLAFFKKTIGFEPIPYTPEIVTAERFGLDPGSIPALGISPDPDYADGRPNGSLGENFLTWLWFFQEERGGVLPATKIGEFSLMIEGPLVLVSDEDGAGAVESVIRKGLPTQSAEAKAALTVGKKLKRAKLILARNPGEEWAVTVDADFIFRGLKMPDGEAMDRESIFEERMTNLFIFQTVFFNLYKRFLDEMSDSKKASDYQESAKKWIANRRAL
jgi:hypothetical protein